MNPRLHCEDCKKLVEDYGEDKLKICDDCGHFYKDDEGDLCPCKAEGEMNKK